MKKFIAIICITLFSNALFCQWTQLSPTNTIEFRSLVAQGNLIIAGSEGRQVYISTDNGSTWRESKTGIESVVYVNCIAITGTGILLGTDNGIYFSTDTGLTWTARNGGLTDLNVLRLAVNGQNFFAAGNSGIFYSPGAGTSWTAVNNGINNLTMRAVFATGNYVYAGGGGGVYITSNNGANWTQINTGLPSIATAKHFTVIDNNIFVGTHGQGVYVSQIGTQSWTPANTGTTNLIIEKLITVWSNIFASTWGQGIYVTTNSGTSWSQVNSGFPSLFGKGIAANSTHIFAGGSTDFAGIWRRLLSDMVVSVDKNTNSLPTEYQLEQNYPNPFNPSTVIKYSVPKESYVRLTVYDNLGREIEKLVVGTVAAGTHKITWAPNNITSGIYFITLNAGSSLFIKKAVLLK